jgi:hypothetical protein
MSLGRGGILTIDARGYVKHLTVGVVGCAGILFAGMERAPGWESMRWLRAGR